jgi:hypothetical protein
MQLEMVEEVLIAYRLREKLRRLSREVGSVCRGRINWLRSANCIAARECEQSSTQANTSWRKKGN